MNWSATRLKISFLYRLRIRLVNLVGYLQRLEVDAVSGPNESPATTNADRESLKDVSFAVVITTFEERQEQFCLPLVASIRQFGFDGPIILVVNGELNSQIDTVRRSAFVQAVNAFGNVHFVMFREIVGLARLWNAGIQAAAAECCVILNDDLLAASPESFNDLQMLASTAARDGLATGNGSWSHFAVTRETIRTVGWFDERFLGFGEEDGDYSWRFRLAVSRFPSRVPLRGLVNVKTASRSRGIAGVGKYSLANSVMMRLKYRLPSGSISLEMEPPPQPQLPTPNFYPGESFRDRVGQVTQFEDSHLVSRLLSESCTQA